MNKVYLQSTMARKTVIKTRDISYKI